MSSRLLRGEAGAPPPDWRAAAVDRALKAEEVGGDAEYALVRAARRALPGSPTLSVAVPSGPRYRAYLAERGARSLLPAGHWRLGRWDGLSPEFSWHSLAHGGGPPRGGTQEVEAAAFPSRHRGIGLLVFGHGGAASEGALKGFAEDLLAYCARPTGRALVYSNNEWRGDASLEEELGRVTWEGVVLAEGLARKIRASVEGFFGRREAYRAMGVPWRRGVLLVGPPGTGKTMATKALAASLPEVPFLYVRDLSGYDTQEEMIAEVFGRARELAPAVLVFEDVDGFVTPSNRSVFLNELDGFKGNDGLLVLASSNHPERVDEALLRRPSRFDRVFRLGLPGEGERREYCRRLLLGRPGLLGLVGGREGAEALAGEVARATGGFTLAYVQEAFVSAALEVAHGEGGPAAAAGGTGGEASPAFGVRVLRHAEALRAHVRDSREPEKLGEMRDPERPGLGFRST